MTETISRRGFLTFGAATIAANALGVYGGNKVRKDLEKEDNITGTNSAATAAQDLAGYALGAAVSTTIITSSAVGIERTRSRLSENNSIDPTPVSKPVEDSSEKREYTLIERVENNIPITLLGIAHTRSFAERHYDTIEDAVKKSSVVLTEGDPTDFVEEDRDNGFASFYGTVAKLSLHHGKALVSVGKDHKNSFFAGVLTAYGSLMAVTGAYGVIDSRLSLSTKIRNAVLTGVGSYLFMSNFSLSLPLKVLASRVGSETEEETLKKFSDNERHFFSYVTDCRNVQIANTLANLDKILPKEDINPKKPVTVIYGRAHLPGIEYYLDHPRARKYKTNIYRHLYEHFAPHEIRRFTYDGGEFWKIENLPYVR